MSTVVSGITAKTDYITVNAAVDLDVSGALNGKITFQGGNITAFDVADDAIDADGIDDSSATHKFVTAAQRTQIGTNQTNLSTAQQDIVNIETKTDLITVSSGEITSMTLGTNAIPAEKIETDQDYQFVSLTLKNQIGTDSTATTANAAKTKTDLIETDSDGISGFTIGDGVTVLSTDYISEDVGRTFKTAIEQNKLDKITYSNTTTVHNLDSEASKVSASKIVTDKINTGIFSGQTKITSIVAENGNFDVEDGREKMGHLTSNSNGITAIQVGVGESISLGDAAAFFAGSTGGTENRSGFSNKRLLLIDTDGGMEEVAAGSKGHVLKSGGTNEDPAFGALTLPIASISARVTSQFVNSYYYGSSSFGFNYPIWSSINFNNASGNPYARRVNDDYAHCGIVSPMAFSTLQLKGTIRNDTTTDNLSVFLGKHDTPNGSSSTMVLTELGTDEITVSATDRHYDVSITSTAGVAQGELIFIGVAGLLAQAQVDTSTSALLFLEQHEQYRQLHTCH